MNCPLCSISIDDTMHLFDHLLTGLEAEIPPSGHGLPIRQVKEKFKELSLSEEAWGEALYLHLSEILEALSEHLPHMSDEERIELAEALS